MNRSALCRMTFASLLLVVSLASLAAQELDPGPPKKPSLPLPPFDLVSTTPGIIQYLNEPLDMNDFQGPMKLKDALSLLQEKMAAQGKDLSILVDEDALKPLPKKDKTVSYQAPPAKVEPPKKEPTVWDTVIQFPDFPNKMPVATFLKLSLAKIPDHNATFLIRGGLVFVTSQSKASVKNLLKEKVAASFLQKPLVHAIYALTDKTGASIVIDPRVGEKFMTPVTATFGNDTSLESALTTLTNLADLNFVVVGDGIYVTTPENADVVRYGPKN